MIGLLFKWLYLYSMDEIRLLTTALLLKDWKCMLDIFPLGVIYKGYPYTTPEDFEPIGSYEDDARYIYPAQAMMEALILKRILELIQ